MMLKNHQIGLRWRMTAVAIAIALTSNATTAAQEPANVGLYAGTVVAIRTLDRVSSKGAASELEYKGTVDDSIVVNGVTRVPVGTPAFLRVVKVQQAGDISGRTSLSLRLVALEVSGQRIEFDTADAVIKSTSQAAQAAKSGVTGAVIGGILGGLLGGKSGAVQGAAIGAASGVVAASVVGQNVVVPSETRLSFTLSGNSVPSTSAPVDTAVLAQLMTIENEAGEAAKAGNRPVVDALLDPAFSGIFDGKAVSRSKYLSQIKPQKKMVSGSVESSGLEVSNDRAALSGYYTLQVRQKSEVKTIRQKFRDVFVLRDGRWLLFESEVVTQ